MTPRKRFAIAAAVVVAAISGLIAWALAGSTAYYVTPSELASESVDPAARVRVAGKVVEGTVVKEGPTTTFAITDGKADINVVTRDVLPDTFGTGIEAVAEGAMGTDGVFNASTVLAKCPSKFKAKAPEAPR